MQIHPQVVPVLEAKSQGEVHIEEAWRHYDGCVEAQPSDRVIKCVLGCYELLTLG